MHNVIAVVALIATTTAGAAACPIGARCVVSTDTLACPSHKVAIELVNKSRRVNKLLTGAARENMVDEIVEKASRSACSALKSSVAVRVVEEDSGWGSNLACVASARGGASCLWVDADAIDRP